VSQRELLLRGAMVTLLIGFAECCFKVRTKSAAP